MTPIEIVQVDAFTDRPFAGNPAAVCLLDAADPRADDAVWMQLVAREMNLSETAFVHRRSDRTFTLRWFTPAVEVDLCGHATLATAHVLWQDRHVEAGEALSFDTRSGRLGAAGHDGWIELDFPATPPRPVEPPGASLRHWGSSHATWGKAASMCSSRSRTRRPSGA